MSEHKWFEKFMGVPTTEQTDKQRWIGIIAWLAGTALLFIALSII
jgi:hypothetical protein